MCTMMNDDNFPSDSASPLIMPTALLKKPTYKHITHKQATFRLRTKSYIVTNNSKEKEKGEKGERDRWVALNITPPQIEISQAV